MSQPYHSLEAELHDLFWEAEDDGSEVRLMADFLDKHPGTALEIGSGSGRLMFPLVQAGFDVEGLELSDDMIALGNLRAAGLGVSAKVHAGDMTGWDDGRRFAALLAPAFTLQLAADPVVALLHWRRLVIDGGGLYLTVFMPYAELLGDLPENEWYMDHEVTLADGRKGVLETRHLLDRDAQRVEREHRYTLSGDPPRTHVSRQNIRWIEHPELVTMLAECGFQVDRFFLDFDPARVTEDPERENFDGILTYLATAIRS